MNVTENVILKKFCIGCGVCSAVCPSSIIEMKMRNGGYFPALTGICKSGCRMCSTVCPVLRLELRKNKQEMVCAITRAFTGYVDNEQLRLASASGGLVSWLLNELVKRKHVEYVVCVKSNDGKPYYSYTICNSTNEINACANSVYYPVNLQDALKSVRLREGRCAIVALPCVAHGISRLRELSAMYRKKIELVIGLTCSSQKTTYFSDYIMKSLDVDEESCKNIRYRIKKNGRPVRNYTAGCRMTDGVECSKRVSDMSLCGIWEAKYFTPAGCLCCDDGYARYADAVFMDAWLPEYRDTDLGWSLVLSRNELINGLLQNGEGIKIAATENEKAEVSQYGIMRDKVQGFGNRIGVLHLLGFKVPPWALKMKTPISWKYIFSFLQVITAIQSNKAMQSVIEKEGGIRKFNRNIWLIKSIWLLYRGLRRRVKI